MSASIRQPPKNRESWFRRHDSWLITGVLILLTLFVSWPLPRYFGRYLAGQDSDVPINLWANWWTGRALAGASSLWESEHIFFPQGADLTFHSFSHLNSVAALMLEPLLGQIAAYNCIILTNYILVGLAMYHLARYLTGSRQAAFLAALVFAFNSHSQYQSAHPVLLSVWCLPWLTLYLLRLNETGARRYIFALAVMLTLTAATSTLLLIMAGIWLAALTIYVWLDPAWPKPAWGRLLVAAGLGAAGSLPFLGQLLAAYIWGANENFLISSAETLYIADILSPLIPHWYVWLVRGLYIGLVPLLLLIGARHRWRFSRLWYGLFFLAYLFSIGPFPILAGQKLALTLPWSFLVVPLLRNPYRLNIYLSLALAILVAWGWLALAQQNFQSVRAWRIGLTVCAVLITAEYSWPAFPLTDIPVSAFFSDYLADVPDDVALAVVPANRSIGKTYMYLQTQHGHPITGGAISRRDETIFAYQAANPILRAALDERDLAQLPADVDPARAALAQANIGYIVIHLSYLDEEIASQWRAILGDEPVYEDELVLVYATG